MICAMVEDIPGVKRANEIITIHHGPQSLMVCISLDFQDKITSNQIEAIVSQLEREIRATIPEVSKVFVEAQNWRSHQKLLEKDGA